MDREIFNGKNEMAIRRVSIILSFKKKKNSWYN